MNALIVLNTGKSDVPISLGKLRFNVCDVLLANVKPLSKNFDA